MASIDTARTTGLGTGFTGLFGAAFTALRDWNDARITRKSLLQLSARELDDIGLCYGDIDAISARSSRR